MSVYFIQRGVLGPVKIGTSGNVPGRLYALQNKTDEPLNLIRVVDGSFIEERWLHVYFHEYAIEGEWFTFTEEMMTVTPRSEIKRVLSDGPTSLIEEITFKAALKGMSIAAMCRRAGINRAAYTRWKRGGHIPSGRIIMRMIEAIETVEHSEGTSQ